MGRWPQRLPALNMVYGVNCRQWNFTVRLFLFRSLEGEDCCFKLLLRCLNEKMVAGLAQIVRVSMVS